MKAKVKAAFFEGRILHLIGEVIEVADEKAGNLAERGLIEIDKKEKPAPQVEPEKKSPKKKAAPKRADAKE